MKKTLTLLLGTTLVLAPFNAFAEPSAETLIRYQLEKTPGENLDKIQVLSRDLSLEDKLDLYEDYQRDDELILTIGANMLTPIAVGSFVQGDQDGAWFNTWLGLGSSALALTAMTTYQAAPQNPDNETDQSQAGLLNGIAMTTGAVALGLALWSAYDRIQRPMSFQKMENQKLWNALNLDPAPMNNSKYPNPQLQVGMKF